MKRIITIILMLFVVGIADSPKAKKFEVIFTVKYNAITLEEAAKKETMFRELYKDACIVDVKVKESQGLTALTLGGGISFYSNDTITVDDLNLTGTIDITDDTLLGY